MGSDGTEVCRPDGDFPVCRLRERDGMARELRLAARGPLTLRFERSSDEGEVRNLLMAAFGRPHEALLVEDLRKSGKVVFAMVAESEGRR